MLFSSSFGRKQDENHLRVTSTRSKDGAPTIARRRFPIWSDGACANSHAPNSMPFCSRPTATTIAASVNTTSAVRAMAFA